MITYTSSDTDVAYVNMSGLLVSMGIEGKCTVTASRDNESYNLKVIVSSEAALIQPLPEGLNYTTDASTKTLTIEYSPEAQGEIVIPAKTEIDGEVYTITELGLRAFADAYSRITSIYVPNTVTKIGKHAFIHCDHLTYLHIGFATTFIGEGALGFANIELMDCEAITPPTLDIDCMYACSIGTLRVPFLHCRNLQNNIV